MKLAQINAYSAGSTGRLMLKSIWRLSLVAMNHMFFGLRGDEPQYTQAIRVGTALDVYAHAARARVTGRVGFCGSKHATERMVQRLRRIEPDIIHLHNLHWVLLSPAHFV